MTHTSESLLKSVLTRVPYLPPLIANIWWCRAIWRWLIQTHRPVCLFKSFLQLFTLEYLADFKLHRLYFNLYNNIPRRIRDGSSLMLNLAEKTVDSLLADSWVSRQQTAVRTGKGRDHVISFFPVNTGLKGYPASLHHVKKCNKQMLFLWYSWAGFCHPAVCPNQENSVSIQSRWTQTFFFCDSVNIKRKDSYLLWITVYGGHVHMSQP